MTDSIPMIDSILYPQQKAMWMKLHDMNPLVHLHHKFWIQGEAGNILLNPREPGDNRDGDDDIGPNCQVLDIGLPTLGIMKLWIRNEYVRMYKYCEHHLDTNRNAFKSPAVVVTGQPGIGMSYWIYYALCRRLAEKKPVLWFRHPLLYLFVSDGVYESPTGDISSTLFRTRVWTLVDVDSDKHFPPVLSQQGTNNLNIFATSPRQKRWAGLTKTTTYKVAYMNPWTRREISEAAPVHGLAGNDARIEDIYNRYGPVARICFEFATDDSRLNEHRARFEAALSTLSSKALQGMVAGILKADKSHTILLLKRLPGSDFTLSTVGIITPTAEMAVRDQLRRETDTQRFELYQSLVSVAVSRGLAGVAYEWLAQEKLRRHATITLNLFPMEQRTLDGSGSRKKRPRWYTKHGVGASALPINVDREAFDSFDKKPDSIKNQVYYTPSKPNQVAFDSFIMDNNRLFIFQFTIGTDHKIKEGILPFFSQSSLPPRANWYFIFVVPPDLSELSCPQEDEMKAFLEEVHLCSMVLDPQP